MNTVGDQASRSAAIFITKLGAAERQLNAAVRMILAGEDELAVHTVAASAYRVLRDIVELRGQNSIENWWRSLIIGAAQLVANGKRLPLSEEPFRPVAEIIESIARDIENGRTTTIDNLEFRLPTSYKNAFWAEVNKTANFLKHADKDVDDILRLETVDFENKMLMVNAIGTFYDLFGRASPECKCFSYLRTKRGLDCRIGRTNFLNDF